MGLVGNLLERRGYMTLDQLDQWMDRGFGLLAATGKDVSPVSAMSSVAVYSCVALLAETIAALPKPVYRRLPSGGKERASNHSLYKILHDAPNDEMTAYEFWECQVGHLCTWGNAFSEIERSDRGVRGLWPLRPDRMTLKRNGGNQLFYEYRLPSGEPKLFAKDMIMHLRGLSSNGVIGYSPIMQARESVALAQATEEFAARFFGNDARPGGFLSAPGKVKDVDRMKANWDDAHKGLSKSHRIAVLEDGVTWQSVSMPLQDAQFLESRKFQLNEICRLYRVPPHMVSDVERSTSWGTGIEQQSLGFVIYTLLPWLTRIEQRIHQDLFTPAERQNYFCEHLVDGLLRGDAVTRAQAFQIWRQNGVLSADEWREKENMNPLPEGQGQVYWMPANMQPADVAVKLAEKKLSEPTPGKQAPLSDDPVRSVGTLGPSRVSVRKMSPADWQSAYANGIPHWAEDLTPSLFAQDFAADVAEAGGGRILEIGCGNGRDSIFFARAGLTVDAVDVAQGAVDLASQNAKDAGVSVAFQMANAEVLPFSDRIFDALFSLSVLHASDLTVSIPETGRVMKTGGLALIYIYADTTFADGKTEEYTTVDDFLELLKASYEVLDFYSEQEDEFDEYGEKHRILVAHLKRL